MLAPVVAASLDGERKPEGVRAGYDTCEVSIKLAA
jgi:hypothetical protein